MIIVFSDYMKLLLILITILLYLEMLGHNLNYVLVIRRGWKLITQYYPFQLNSPNISKGIYISS